MFRGRLRLADGTKSDRFDLPADMSETQARAYLAGLQAEEDSSHAIANAKQGRLVASRLDDDSSSKVRIAAIDAARVREPTDVLAHAVVVAVTSAQDPHVRYQAVELMTAWVERRADLRPVLEQVAEKDAEARVRERARVAL